MVIILRKKFPDECRKGRTEQETLQGGNPILDLFRMASTVFLDIMFRPRLVLVGYIATLPLRALNSTYCVCLMEYCAAVYCLLIFTLRIA